MTTVHTRFATPARRLALTVAAVLLTGLAAQADGEGVPVPIPVPANKAPVIKDFKAVCYPMGVVVFSGKVEDEAPAGLTVTFTAAAASVNGKTCVTKSDGSFEYTVKMDLSESGEVEATTVDKQGLKSAAVSDYVTPRP